MGHSAFALSADLGLGISAATSDPASDRAVIATFCDRYDRGAAFLYDVDPDIFQSRRSPDRVLYYRPRMSRRACPNQAARARSDGGPCFVILRWRHRWSVRRINRSLYVFVGRRISDPRRAGGSLPSPFSGHLEAVQPLALAVVAVAMALPRQLVLARGHSGGNLSAGARLWRRITPRR